MAFVDVIDNYGNGQTGTISSGTESVGYTITSTASTQSSPNTDQGARISADGGQSVTVTFDSLVKGVTLQLDRSNPGEIYRIRIDGVDLDMQALIDSGQATFTTVIAGSGAPGTHIITSGGMSSTGTFSNGSLGFLTLNIPIQSIEVFGAGGTASNFDLAEIGIDTTEFAVVCFAADTDLQTPCGPRKVGDLRAGDCVITQDGRTQRIIATNARHLRPIALYRETRLRPVRIAAGALGDGLPVRDLLVSRQHRILVASRIARRICGQDEVLIPAFRLVGIPGIEISRAVEPVSYYHILLDRHDIVLANGAPAETLFLGPMSMAAFEDEMDDMRAVEGDAHAHGTGPARPFVTAAQAKQIVDAHIRHQRPLLEPQLCVAKWWCPRVSVSPSTTDNRARHPVQGQPTR